MKRIFLFLLLASLACVLPTRISTGAQKSSTSIPAAPAPSLRSAAVMAEHVRLRTHPDGYGGREIQVMTKGSYFLVSRCQKFDSTLWAYGRHQSQNGWAAARYLKGACP